MLKFVIKREQNQACLNYAEPTNETRAEDACILCLVRRRKTKSTWANWTTLNKLFAFAHRKYLYIFLFGMARMTLGSSCYFYTHFGAANSILISKIFSNTTKIVFIKRKSFLSTIKSISQALGCTFQTLGCTSQALGYNFHHRERTYSPLSYNNICVV